MPTDELGNEFDNAPWRRKLDDPDLPDVVPAPARHYYPTVPMARSDLIEYVQLAEKRLDAEQVFPNPATEVRASGRHWALSDAALTRGVIVETNQPPVRTPPGNPPPLARPPMNRTLREVVPRAMTTEALRFFIAQPDVAFDPTKVPDHSRFYLYHVEAGTQIWELYCRLDAADHNRDSLAKRMQEEFGNPNYLGPWAMPTLGGAGGQTIVGAFSTGTHGGDVHLPPIADAAQAIHLIGAQGRQYWIERPLAPGVDLVDEEKLRAVYGEIEVIRDPEALAAVAVACGRMGIIYSVVLRVVRQYALEEHRWEDRWSQVRTWIHNPAHPLFASHRFVQVLANPLGLPDDSSEHACFFRVRNMVPLDAAGTPEPRGRAERCTAPNGGNSVPLLSEPGSFANRICATDSPVHAALDELIGYRTAAVIAAAAISATALLLGNLAAAAIAAAVAVELNVAIDKLEELNATLPPGPLGKTMAVAGQWALDNDRMEILRGVSDYLVREEHSLDKDNPITAVSYALMDIHNYKDVGCSTSGDSLEVFFDVTTAAAGKNMVAFMDRFFQRINELENGWLPKEGGGVTGTKMVFPGYCALRFMSGSSALLAPQKWNRVCSIEIAGFRAVPGTEAFLAAVERDALEMGAALHWGQRNNIGWEQVENLYGAFFPTDPLARWRFWLSRVSENGRHPIFSTAFTRDRALEVIQPQVGSFTVVPTEGCAGEPVRITWEASRNPPGTTARLEIRPPNSSTPLSVILLDTLEGPWDTLAGTKDIALPTGRAEFHFIVEQALNHRPIPVPAIVPVRGFSEHDILTFQLPATCAFVAGAARWSTRVSLAGTVSPRLRVETVCRGRVDR